MSFRTRLALASALAVAIAVVVASASAYLLVRAELRDEVDDALRSRAALAPREPVDDGELDPIRPPRFGGPAGVMQVVSSSGVALRTDASAPELPVTAAALAVARGERASALEDVTVDGAHLRMLTRPIGDDLALQLARPLDEVDAVLSHLRLLLTLASVGGIGLAAVLGLAVSRTAIGPLRRVTETAEAIAETGDLGRRVGVDGTDEVARLAGRFDAMLDALEESQRAQRGLVADASHELRTPIATIRTNVDLLKRHPELSAAERDAALAAAGAELEELGSLVTDIVELARDGTEPPPVFEPFRLDEVVGSAVARARAAHPSCRFELTATESVVDGVAERVQRAAANLLDNAAKWSPAGGAIEVRVQGAEVSVRDHGPGIPADERERVFDRFYRTASARGRPGSGLGLAIVKQVADLHGGTAVVEEAPGGGALVRLTLSRS